MKITPEFLTQRFLAGFDRRVNELSVLAGKRDVTSLERAFHSLAGIGGTYGFPEVTRLAREGERLCQTGDVSRVERIVAAMWGIKQGIAA
jgi:hypothetical protein